ncbi:ATP synthase F1 subunit epsilon [Candidatus Parcubacteria bacterium]|nr:MAG: ATP synthase F1 subunit epsilon [Candidatus Parcubacteria bacterium]
MVENKSKFHLEIVSPEGVIFQDQVQEAVIPAYDGEITVLPNHTPLLSRLKEGEIIIKYEKEELLIAITGGFLEINNNNVYISSDYAVKAKDIEIAKAQQAKKRAEELLREKAENVDLTLIEKDLQRSILELKVAEKIRKKQRIIQ